MSKVVVNTTEPKVESITVTLTLQEFATLDTLTYFKLSGSHPLRTIVVNAAKKKLPGDVVRKLDAAVEGGRESLDASFYRVGTYGYLPSSFGFGI